MEAMLIVEEKITSKKTNNYVNYNYSGIEIIINPNDRILIQNK